MYMFPLLKNAEILQCMTDLHIPLTESDLAKPSQPLVQRLFESMADQFMGITKEQFEQPNFAVMDVLEQPSLHMEAITVMTFYRQLAKLMIEVGIDDFSLRDITRPEPPRLRRILSAVINFAKFREMRLGVYEKLTLTLDESNDRRAVLEQRNQELTDRVNSIRLQRAEEEPAVQKLQEINTGLKNELRELKKQQEQITASIENLKNAKKNETEKMANLDSLVGSLRRECAYLQTQIVHSPEKLKQNIAEMHSNIAIEKGNLASVEKKARDLQTRMETLELLESDMSKVIAAMEECEMVIKRLSSEQKKQAESKEKLEKMESVLKEECIRDQQLKRQVTTAQEKLVRIHRQQEEKRASSEQMLRDLRRQHENLVSERAAIQAKVAETETLIREKDDQIAQLRRHHESDLITVREEYLRMKAQVENYHNELRLAMQSASKGSKIPEVIV